MRKLSVRLTVALLTFVLGIAATTMWFINRSSVENVPHRDANVSQREDITLVFREGQETRTGRPDNAWESIYFEEINERARVANLRSLRSIALSRDDFEVRVWHGFGITALEGFVLKRVGGQWSAIHLDDIYSRSPQRGYQRRLRTPSSGWDVCWRQLVNAGILVLPSASAVQCETGINDGMSYVVEINLNQTYRTYMYDNPYYARCNEARQIIEIGEIIANEFGVEELRTRE